jgi:hypothetical protein
MIANRAAHRGQSTVIGAVLLFGIAIVAVSSWQAFGIPMQNEQIEFNHNQQAQEDLTDLRTTVISATDATTLRATTINLVFATPAASYLSIHHQRLGRLQPLKQLIQQSTDTD